MSNGEESTTRNAVVAYETKTGRVVVAIKEYKGKTYVDARKQFRGEDDEWHPTQKGLMLEPAAAKRVAELMLEAAAVLEG